MGTIGKLILIRHGQSRWNLDKEFTGWVDVPLSTQGIKEAQDAAKKLKNIKFDIAFTSTLERAQETLLIALAEHEYTGVFVHEQGKRKRWSHHQSAGHQEIPVHSSSKLNERYYGDLQGLNKDVVRRLVGDEQVFLWRRGYDNRPPGGESLKDVFKRVVPYARKKILPYVTKGNNVLVAAHGNSLRALIKYLENISDKDVEFLELPTGKPIIYEYRNNKLERVSPKKVLHIPKHLQPQEGVHLETTIRLTDALGRFHIDHKTIHPLILEIENNKITISGHAHWHDLEILNHKKKITIDKEDIIDVEWYGWPHNAIKLAFKNNNKQQICFIKYMDRTFHPYNKKQSKEIYHFLKILKPHITSAPQHNLRNRPKRRHKKKTQNKQDLSWVKHFPAALILLFGGFLGGAAGVGISIILIIMYYHLLAEHDTILHKKAEKKKK